MADTDTNSLSKGYKYRIEQTCKGAGVYGDTIDQIVADYVKLRVKLESEGFKVAPEE